MCKRIDDDKYVAIARWILFSWAIDCFEITPRLHLISAEKQSGKTTLIKVLMRLVRKGPRYPQKSADGYWITATF
jgi:hypothetical protein